MSTSPNLTSFGKFIPGFDFLQSLSKHSASGAPGTPPLMPNLGSWITPTLNEEELTKRIDELKAVSYWLDQNATALKATIQAMEVQKMTLSTLKSMNFNFGNNNQSSHENSSAEVEKVDPMQWWQALTQQFGAIASKTMQDAAEKAAAHQAEVQQTSSQTSAPTKSSAGSVTLKPKPKPKLKTATKTKTTKSVSK